MYIIRAVQGAICAIVFSARRAPLSSRTLNIENNAILLPRAHERNAHRGPRKYIPERPLKIVRETRASYYRYARIRQARSKEFSAENKQGDTPRVRR